MTPRQNSLRARPSSAHSADQAGAALLELRSIAKSFGPVTAIQNVSLILRRGRVHTILGENGAGKSTLMKILAGVHAPTRGELVLRGQPVAFANPSDAQTAGISIIHQELSLAANLSVAENMFAGQAPQRAGIVDSASMFRHAQQQLNALGIELNARALVARLSMAQRQFVEIAKGLRRHAEIVLMDEPTSSLGHHDTEVLFNIVARLKTRGVAIVYISHRMDEIMRISDDISVMRDGQFLGTYDKRDATIGALIKLMVGRDLRDAYPPRTRALDASRAPRLEVRHLTIEGKFHDVSFSVRPGEIFGFFGLIGSGRSDLMNALFGIGRASGQILMEGTPLCPRSPEDAIAAGIAFVTENRKREGLVLTHSVAHNITMASFARQGARFGVLSRPFEQRAARNAIARMKIRCAGPHQAVGDLSGGNQQKIVFSKWLMLSPRLLILDEPTRGIDVGAKFELYRMMRDLADAGAAILLVSSDLPEALAMSDRLAVMRKKRLVKTFNAADLNREAVMSYATGAASS